MPKGEIERQQAGAAALALERRAAKTAARLAKQAAAVAAA